MIPKNKKAQEEMIGFALIIIVVAVILLVFLRISLRSPEKEGVESYEVESFIQAFLQYHTNCSETYEANYLSIRELIFSCDNAELCLDERDSCEVLESTLKEITEESWQVEGDRPVKGYELNITANGEEILAFQEGEITNNYKGAIVPFPREVDVYFTAYY